MVVVGWASPSRIKSTDDIAIFYGSGSGNGNISGSGSGSGSGCGCGSGCDVVIRY